MTIYRGGGGGAGPDQKMSALFNRPLQSQLKDIEIFYLLNPKNVETFGQEPEESLIREIDEEMNQL